MTAGSPGRILDALRTPYAVAQHMLQVVQMLLPSGQAPVGLGELQRLVQRWDSPCTDYRAWVDIHIAGGHALDERAARIP